MQSQQLVMQSESENAIESRVGDLIAMADRAVIKDDGDVSKAGDLLKFIKSCYNKAEDERKALVKPFNDGVKAINNRFKQYTDPLADAERKVKAKVLAYEQEKQKRLRAEAEERARAEAAAKLEEAAKAEAEGKTEAADRIVAEAAARESAPVQVSAPAPIRGDYGSTTSIRKTWTFELDDITKVPHQYLIVDTKAVNDAIRSGVRDIPGLRIFEKETVAVR